MPTLRPILIVAVLIIALPGLAAARRAKGECQTEVCAARSAIDRACPCAAAESPSRYGGCVAETVRKLAAAGTVSRKCRARVTRCAVQSTCGMPGFVTCHVRRPGRCRPGVGKCAHDPSAACKSDADCVTEPRCQTTPSAEACRAKGGTVSAETSCCPGCS
jgi:hypothetical protein